MRGGASSIYRQQVDAPVLRGVGRFVSVVSFATITLCVASQRVFIAVVYFVIDSVRILLDTPSYALVKVKLSLCFN
jgi:hypothetical protein